MNNKQQTYAFTGVFIPAHIWLSNQMSAIDRLVWAIVDSHHDGSGVCVETDAEIAELLGENEMVVAGSVNRLLDIRFIHSGADCDGNRQLWVSSIRFVEKEPKEVEAVASTADVQRIVDIYNDCCKSLPRAEKLTPARVTRIRSLLKDKCDEEYFKLLFLKTHNSDFLSGRSGRWTGCNIDWILAPANRDRILEGIYDNRSAATAKPFIPENLR